MATDTWLGRSGVATNQRVIASEMWRLRYVDVHPSCGLRSERRRARRATAAESSLVTNIGSNPNAPAAPRDELNASLAGERMVPIRFDQRGSEAHILAYLAARCFA